MDPESGSGRGDGTTKGWIRISPSLLRFDPTNFPHEWHQGLVESAHAELAGDDYAKELVRELTDLGAEAMRRHEVGRQHYDEAPPHVQEDPADAPPATVVAISRALAARDALRFAVDVAAQQLGERGFLHIPLDLRRHFLLSR